MASRQICAPHTKCGEASAGAAQHSTAQHSTAQHSMMYTWMLKETSTLQKAGMAAKLITGGC
jgi:hypothetical protein